MEWSPLIVCRTFCRTSQSLSGFESRHFDLLTALFKFLGRLPAGIIRAGRSSSDLSLSFLDSVTGVVFGVVLVAGAIVSNATDDFFRVIAAGEGAPRESPISF